MQQQPPQQRTRSLSPYSQRGKNHEKGNPWQWENLKGCKGNSSRMCVGVHQRKPLTNAEGKRERPSMGMTSFGPSLP